MDSMLRIDGAPHRSPMAVLYARKASVVAAAPREVVCASDAVWTGKDGRMLVAQCNLRGLASPNPSGDVPVTFLDDVVCGVDGIDMAPTRWMVSGGSAAYAATVKAAFGLADADVLYVHVSQQCSVDDLHGTDGVYLVDEAFGTAAMRPVVAFPASQPDIYVAGFAPLYEDSFEKPSLDTKVNAQVIAFIRAMTEYESGDRALAQGLLATVEAEIVQEETLQRLGALIASNDTAKGNYPQPEELVVMNEMVENLRCIERSRALLATVARPSLKLGAADVRIVQGGNIEFNPININGPIYS
jgi:hypothetical protein